MTPAWWVHDRGGIPLTQQYDIICSTLPCMSWIEMLGFVFSRESWWGFQVHMQGLMHAACAMLRSAGCSCSR